MNNKNIKPKRDKKDSSLEIILRPDRWEDFVGQEKIKSGLRLIIEAAKKRKEAYDHLLFYGQAGLGKTTLAYLVGKETKNYIRSTSGPALEKAGDIAAVLSNLEPYDILFIDEAHRINKIAEEILYPAMESRKLHLIIGKGPSARTFSLDLPPFTIIAATTKISLISSPLRSRFGAIFKLNYYQPEDLEKIISRSAKILEMDITNEAISMLARASRLTPRVANRLLKRSRDYAQVNYYKNINEEVVQKTLEMLEIDYLGLEQSDRLLLETIVKKFGGGPVGLKTLASALNEEIGNIEDVYEPFLMKLGFLNRTPSGRVATIKTYEYLNLPPRSSLL